MKVIPNVQIQLLTDPQLYLKDIFIYFFRELRTLQHKPSFDKQGTYLNFFTAKCHKMGIIKSKPIKESWCITQESKEGIIAEKAPIFNNNTTRNRRRFWENLPVTKNYINGNKVAGLARRVERVEDLSKKLKGEKGKLHAYKCDMTKEEDIVSTFKKIVKELGNIHILVNNAGLLLATDLINGDTQKWKTTLDTNVLGLCIATREAVQNMKAHCTQGHIIHINSVLGHTVLDMPALNVYSATKYAVTGLAETLRLDVRRENLPIKVTSVSPGYVKTEFEEVAELNDIPMPPLYAADIADAVIYALSTPPHVNVKELTVQAVGS